MSQSETWISGGDFKFNSPLKSERLTLAGGNVRSPIITRRRTTLALNKHVGPLLVPSEMENSSVTEAISSSSFYKKTKSTKGTTMVKSLADTQQTSTQKGLALKSVRKHPSMVNAAAAVPARKRRGKSVAVIEESPLEVETDNIAAKKPASSDKTSSVTSRATRATSKSAVPTKQAKKSVKASGVGNASSLKSESPKHRLYPKRCSRSSVSKTMKNNSSPAKVKPPKSKPALVRSKSRTETCPLSTQAHTETRPLSTQAHTETRPLSTQARTETRPLSTQADSQNSPQKKRPRSPLRSKATKKLPQLKRSPKMVMLTAEVAVNLVELSSDRNEPEIVEVSPAVDKEAAVKYSVKVDPRVKNSSNSVMKVSVLEKLPSTRTSVQMKGSSNSTKTAATCTGQISPVKDMSQYIKEIVEEKAARSGSGEAGNLSKTAPISSPNAMAGVDGTTVKLVETSPIVSAPCETPKLQSVTKLAQRKSAKKKTALKSPMKLPTPKSIKKASTPVLVVKSATPGSRTKTPTPARDRNKAAAAKLNPAVKSTKSVSGKSAGVRNSPARRSTINPVEISALVAKTPLATGVTSGRRKSAPGLSKDLDPATSVSTRKRTSMQESPSPKRRKQTFKVVRKATPNRVTKLDQEELREELATEDASLLYHTPDVQPLSQKAGQTPYLTPDISISSEQLDETIQSVDSSSDISQVEEQLTSSEVSSSWCSIM